MNMPPTSTSLDPTQKQYPAAAEMLRNQPPSGTSVTSTSTSTFDPSLQKHYPTAADILRSLPPTSTSTDPSVQKQYQNMHTCEFCQKSFPFKSKLDAHLRTHSDNKQYQCTEYTKAFKHQRSLNWHVLKHHRHVNI